MQETDIYLKTDAGRDEIKSRARGLTMATRAILLMVDGQRNVAALRSVIAGSKAPGDTLETLLAQGLIEVRPATTPVQAPSISTPRSATMARAPSAAAAHDPAPSAPARAEEATAPTTAPFVYDGPLDLTLPTLPAPEPEEALPDARSASAALPDAASVPASSTAAQRYEHLYTMMNEVVRDFLPAHRRYFIQLKIERCGTPEELLELLDALQAALAKSRGDAFASEVISRLRSAAA